MIGITGIVASATALALLAVAVAGWVCALRWRARAQADEAWREATLTVFAAAARQQSRRPVRQPFAPGIKDAGEAYLWANTEWPEDVRRQLIASYRRLMRERRWTS